MQGQVPLRILLWYNFFMLPEFGLKKSRIPKVEQRSNNVRQWRPYLEPRINILFAAANSLFDLFARPSVLKKWKPDSGLFFVPLPTSTPLSAPSSSDPDPVRGRAAVVLGDARRFGGARHVGGQARLRQGARHQPGRGDDRARG